MGLIQAVKGAISNTIKDQWKEYFYCDSFDEKTLVAKGRLVDKNGNNKGSDNIISKGSKITVNDGQCMIIVDDGKVVELSAEPGGYIFDTSTSPSIFSGKLGENIVGIFKEMLGRFTYAGNTGKDQRVYYFNTKEILGNKFGTANPVPFRVVVDENLGYKLSVDLRCNGQYSYRIADPILFYTNVCGNVKSAYTRDSIDSTLKSELLNALQPALAKIAAQKVQYYEIPAHTTDIARALNDVLSAEWKNRRGLEVVNVSVNSVTIPEDQRKKITEWEETAMTTNPTTAAARIAAAQADAMKTAAGNSAGAMTGFMGMGMAQQAGGVNAASLFAMGQNQQPQGVPSNALPAGGWTCPKCGAQAAGKFCPECGTKKPEARGEWTCPSCGKKNSGKFCAECGTPKPADDGSWTCPNCGKQATGKFCPECGTKKPAGKHYRCSKCGWEPEDQSNPPKFCPECGDPINDDDLT